MGSIKALQKREYRAYGPLKSLKKLSKVKSVALHRTRRTPFGAEHMTIQRPRNTPSSDLERTCRRLSVRPGSLTWSSSVAECRMLQLALARHVRGLRPTNCGPQLPEWGECFERSAMPEVVVYQGVACKWSGGCRISRGGV